MANKGVDSPFLTIIDAVSKSTTAELTGGAALEHGLVNLSRCTPQGVITDSYRLYVTVSMCRDGTRVVAVGGIPEESAYVWDVPTSSRLPGCEALLPAASTAISFDPLNRDAFTSSGPNGILFWKVTNSSLASWSRVCDVRVSTADHSRI